jgi:hypothetical protein
VLYKYALRCQFKVNDEMDYRESGNGHGDKMYPAEDCERSTEPSVSIKDGEFLISKGTTTFLWKDYAARISLVK